jgi:hypothetical protein
LKAVPPPATWGHTMPWWQGPSCHLSLVLKRINVPKKQGKKITEQGLSWFVFLIWCYYGSKNKNVRTCDMNGAKGEICKKKKASNTSREETTWKI